MLQRRDLIVLLLGAECPFGIYACYRWDGKEKRVVGYQARPYRRDNFVPEPSLILMTEKKVHDSQGAMNKLNKQTITSAQYR